MMDDCWWKRALLAMILPLALAGAHSREAAAAGAPVTLATTVAVGTQPNGVAVDPTTHTAYVANRGSNTVSVLNGADQGTATIPVGKGPGGIAVNPATHRVYVADRDDGTIAVIDGATNQVVDTIAVGAHPESVAVDSSTNTVYVADEGTITAGNPNGTVHAIDGKTDHVMASAAVGGERSEPHGLAVDPATHHVFVGYSTPSSDAAAMLDGASLQTLATALLGNPPFAVALDPPTHRLYVTLTNVPQVQVLDVSAIPAFQGNPATIRVGANPSGVAADPASQTVYVANAGDNTIAVIDASSNQVTGTVPVGTRPWAVAVDPTTHTVYVANQDSNDVTILNGVGQPSSVPHDNRYFPQTSFRIDNATIWDYFQRRGGVPTFGYPTSRTFTFQGFTVQFFQRRIVQLDQNGQARLLNLLDPGLLNYTQFNGSTFPGVDSALVSTAPDPTNQPAVLAWVQQHAPDTVGSNATNFFHTFSTTVSAQTAFPNGGDASLLPGIELELWGIPTSGAFTDPNNHNFIYLRWQRGIMMYDASTGLTQGILLADYLKAIITGQNLPADVSQEAQGSPFFGQYDPSQPNWVHNQSLLPDTNFTNAFTQE